MKRLVLDNLILKIFSLLIAVLAWALIVGQQTIQETIEVGLAVVPPQKSGVVIANELPSIVKVTVKGARVKLRGLKQSQYRVSIDLADSEPGERMTSIPIQNLDFPPGVEVQRVSPSVINVYIDSIAERMVDVEAKIEGEPEEGFSVSSLAIEPKQIRLVGPRSMLRNRKSISTKAISVNHRTGNFSVQTAVDLPSEKFSTEQTVRVDVTIDEIMEVKEFVGIPVRIAPDANSVPRRAVIVPETVRVKLKGTQNDLKEVKASDLAAFVRIDELPAGVRVKLKPHVKAPADTEVQGTEPPLVSVIAQ